MNEFNVLLNAATNGAPSGSLFDALFARYIAPQESWRELESPLPITILSAGKSLIDYRIYGNTENGESVGELTESGEPTGYKLPMVVRSLNLIDASLSEQTIEIKPSTLYAISRYNDLYNAPDLRFVIYDENDNLIWSDYLGTWYGENLGGFDNAKYFKIKIPDYCLNAVSLVEGKRPTGLNVKYPYPENYIPYQKITTPIYIGSDPLAEDEYVDFGEQKIYKLINGVLTPTDPPTPIPALPTIQGETIIEYNPSETSVVEPEKMYVKYKPQ